MKAWRSIRLLIGFQNGTVLGFGIILECGQSLCSMVFCLCGGNCGTSPKENLIRNEVDSDIELRV